MSTFNLIDKVFLNSDAPAIVSSKRTYSYKELSGAVKACAWRLSASGAEKGQRVAVVCTNSPEYIVLLLALWSNKAIPCLISTRLPAPILQGQIRQAGCSKVIHQPDLNELSRLDKDLIGSENTQISVNPDDHADIIFTSGTGDTPKAAVHSFKNHVMSALGSNEMIQVERNDRWMLSLPLYHIGGLCILFRVLRSGGALVLPVDGESVQEAVKYQSFTHISLVSTQLQRLLEDPASLKRLKAAKAVLVGGSAVPQSLLEHAHGLELPVYVSYGLTEMTSQVATGRYPQPAEVLKHREVMISDHGEIMVGGEVLFQGYIKGNKVELPLNRNGMFATGDLGALTKDRHLKVSGRKDRMFISGGENIQPEEIEKYLNDVRGVKEAIVIPVTHEEFGYRPAALIKQQDGAALSRRAITDSLRDLLPKFKIPEHFYRCPSIKETNGIKLSRREILRAFMEERARFKEYV